MSKARLLFRLWRSQTSLIAQKSLTRDTARVTWTSGTTMLQRGSVLHSSTLAVVETRTTSRQSQSVWRCATLTCRIKGSTAWSLSPLSERTTWQSSHNNKFIQDPNQMIVRFLSGQIGPHAPPLAAVDGCPWSVGFLPCLSLEERVAPRSWRRERNARWSPALQTPPAGTRVTGECCRTRHQTTLTDKKLLEHKDEYFTRITGVELFRGT